MYDNNITLKDIPCALTGDKLKKTLTEKKKKRQSLAEGFLYEKTFNMIYSDAGIGKSTILIQMCVELAAGLPVWGFFPTKKPFKVLYVQGERDIIETTERLELLKKTYPINTNNLVITDEYQRFNLMNDKHANLFILCIKRDCPDADLICIDPIYSMVKGGLKEDLQAASFTKSMSNVQKATGAVMVYGHHIVKPTFEKGEKYQRDDPFYGSTWLKAHSTAMIYMQEHADGVQLSTKKDNYKLLSNKCVLEYNGETGLVSVPLSELPAIERVKNFIRAQGQAQKDYTFKDIETATKVCTRHLREILVHSSIKNMFFVVSSSKNKNLYRTCTSNSSCAVH